MTDELKNVVAKIQPGPITDTILIERPLACLWPELKGGDEGGMEGYKLNGRMENLRWQPPKLSFTIERHGSAARGSTRAELQEWTVDLDQMTANYVPSGGRQCRPRNRPLHVTPEVEETVRLIIQGQKDPRLRWDGGDKVKVLVQKIYPKEMGVPEQTLRGRRKRFKEALVAKLQAEGWCQISPYTVQKDHK
jgi:hypothetical protein